MLRTVVLISLAFVLSACSDPRSYDVTKLTDEQRKELGQKLTADEGQKLAGWMMRQAFKQDSLPLGTTVAQAIKEQDEWLTKQKEEELRVAELKKKIEAERRAKQEEFARMLSVVLVGKKNSVGEYDRRFISLELAYENKTDKDIKGVKGILKIADIFGDKIINLRWPYDGGAPAKQTTVERGVGVKVNQFMDDHMKLWNANMDKLKATFEVQTIIFSDGTKIDSPE
jgi:hypothetical protein